MTQAEGIGGPTKHEARSAWRWQVAVALFVALGSLVTAGYAVVETFWG